MTTRVLGILAALAMTLSLAGCGDEKLDRASSAVDFSLPVGEPSYDVDAPSWAVGDTVHVGDQKLTVSPAPDAYVVATHGIYYVTKETLYFTDGGPVVEVGAIASPTLVESADGRYLGTMAEADDEDAYGTAPRVPVVFDLETGAEILHAEPGQVTRNDDLADLYEDASVGFLGFADGAAYVDDPLRDGTTRFPLDRGRPEAVPTDDFGLAQLPAFAGERGVEVILQQKDTGGYELSATGDGYSGVLSPDERYVFADGDDAGAAFYDATSGEQIRFDPGSRSFLLGGWVDDETFYGATGTRGPQPHIVSCSTTTRACTSVSRGLGTRSVASLLFGTGAATEVY